MSAVSDETTIGEGFAERTVNAGDWQLRCFEAGAGEALVVLHGAGGIHLTRALDMLAQCFRVMAFEMPGFGEQPGEAIETLDDLAEVVAAAIDACGLERYHLLGTSFGGATALRLTTLHPDQVISLVLESPAAFREGASRPGPDVAPEQLARWLRRHPERPPRLAPPDPEFQARVWPMVDRLLGGEPYDEELAARLTQLPTRTLVVFGEFDGLIPVANGRTYRRLLQTCSFQIVADAAHDIQGDRPEAFAELVGEFLSRGMAFLLPDADTLINP